MMSKEDKAYIDDCINKAICSHEKEFSKYGVITFMTFMLIELVIVCWIFNKLG